MPMPRKVDAYAVKGGCLCRERWMPMPLDDAVFSVGQ